jgi:hypothetical protein
LLVWNRVFLVSSALIKRCIVFILGMPLESFERRARIR